MAQLAKLLQGLSDLLSFGVAGGGSSVYWLTLPRLLETFVGYHDLCNLLKDIEDIVS